MSLTLDVLGAIIGNLPHALSRLEERLTAIEDALTHPSTHIMPKYAPQANTPLATMNGDSLECRTYLNPDAVNAPPPPSQAYGEVLPTTDEPSQSARRGWSKQRLKVLIKNRETSEFAKLIGVASSTVWNWKAGAPPRRSYRYPIAKALGLTIKDIDFRDHRPDKSSPE